MDAVSFSSDQLAVLHKASRCHALAYVRLRCLALLALSRGQDLANVSGLLGLGKRALGEASRRFGQGGLKALFVQPGRGRRRSYDPAALEAALRQGPRAFGIERERWTIDLLRTTAGTGVDHLSHGGCHKALAREGFAYKRAQPVVHSPDPAYQAKKKS